MINKSTLFLVFMWFALKTFAQVDSVKIMGVIYQSGDKKFVIENAEVVLFNETDTIARYKTDELGKFNSYVNLSANHTYKLSIRHKYFVEGKHEFNVVDLDRTFLFEIGLLKLLIDYGPPIYEFNQVEMFYKVDYEYFNYFNYFNEDIKKMCIKIIHHKLKDESDEIVQQRMFNYERLLVQSGINRNQFSIEIKTLDCEQRIDCLATTETWLVSIESDCHE